MNADEARQYAKNMLNLLANQDKSGESTDIIRSEARYAACERLKFLPKIVVHSIRNGNCQAYIGSVFPAYKYSLSGWRTFANTMLAHLEDELFTRGYGYHAFFGIHNSESRPIWAEGDMAPPPWLAPEATAVDVGTYFYWGEYPDLVDTKILLETDIFNLYSHFSAFNTKETT